MEDRIVRTYLHYYDTRIGKSIILTFRSEDSLNNHLAQHDIPEEAVVEITNKLPINPNLSHIEVNRILQSVGYQEFNKSKTKGGVKHRPLYL